MTAVWVGPGHVNGQYSQFSSFTINWDGQVINLAGNNGVSNVSLSSLLGGGGQWCAAGSGYAGDANCVTGQHTAAQAGTFVIFAGPVANAGGGIFNLNAFGGGSNFAKGTFTATETSVTAVPEPGSLGMMLLGLGALVFFWVRRRNGLSRRLLGSRQL